MPMADTNPDHFDVVIIGAGINGAGVFRDLCAQGLRCLIVDKGDFGAGTSAAPSRLIHGGLKYLETGELRLVAESTYERNLLLRNAAHLVKPLPTVIPIYSWAKGVWAAIRTLFGSTTAPRSRGALIIKIGLMLYDLYGSRARQMPRHRMVGRKKALDTMPNLTPRIVAAGTYYDASITAPERLVLELVEDGLDLSVGAEALNWTAITDYNDKAIELSLADGRTRAVTTRLVINAAGPWIDAVNGCLGSPTKLIGGTKGSHILLDHPELLRQLDGRMIYFEGDDGRILLAFPYHGRALVGSTDIPAANPDDVSCDDTEIAYFMHSLTELFPGLNFNSGQIVYTYSGIRPLPASDAVAPGLISRDHSTPVLQPEQGRDFPIICLVGGKWTTFRAFSAEVTDMALRELSLVRKQATDDMPIGGGRDMPSGRDNRAAWCGRAAQEANVSPQRMEALLGRYGTTASRVACSEGPSPDYLPDTEDFSEAEIRWICENEQVVHLEDILLRRTQLAITGQLTVPLCRQICDIAAVALGWSHERKAIELGNLAKLLSERHGVYLDLPVD